MKKLAVLAAVALSAAFIPFKSLAADPILNVSATIKYQSPASTQLKGTVGSMSFNEKSVYALITNALAGNNGTLGTNITPVVLPANGYIAFSLNNTNADGTYGVFYVTNKAGNYYPLSGLDSNGQYYSFIEFDTFAEAGYSSGGSYGFPLGYDYILSSVSSYNLNSTTGNGSGAGTSIGVFYIHDNPYAWDAADYPYILPYGANGQGNMNAIEIRGIVTAPLKYTAGSGVLSTLSLTGTGDSIFDGSEFNSLVSSGKATIAP